MHKLHKQAASSFLRDVDVTDLPGVGYATGQKLSALGIETCAQVIACTSCEVSSPPQLYSSLTFSSERKQHKQCPPPSPYIYPILILRKNAIKDDSIKYVTGSGAPPRVAEEGIRGQDGPHDLELRTGVSPFPSPSSSSSSAPLFPQFCYRPLSLWSKSRRKYTNTSPLSLTCRFDGRLVELPRPQKSHSSEINYGLRPKEEGDIANVLGQLASDVEGKLKTGACGGTGGFVRSQFLSSYESLLTLL